MITQDCIDKAMKKAQGAQAVLNRSESADITYESDKLKSANSSQTTSLSIKVILDKKIGTAGTTDITDIDGVVSRALEAAEFGSPAHFDFPGPAKGEEVTAYDKNILSISKEELVEAGRIMKDKVKAYNSEILVDAGAGTDVSTKEFANSSGMTYTAEKTYYSQGIHGQLIRGTDMLFAGDWLSRCKGEIDPEERADRAIRLFKWGEKNVEIDSGDMPVIFTPQGMNVILLALKLGFNGRNVFFGSSPLSDKLGKKIADDRFTVIDDPLYEYALGTRSFDNEGIPCKPLPLIEKGIAKNFLYDLDTAGRAGTISTGHGPGCSPTNAIIQKGDTSFEKMVEGIDQGLLVYSCLGLGQGNPISGEFSVNIHLGYKIENGKVAGRVKDVMLAGNTYDAIQNIGAIGDEPEWVGSLLSPHIKINNLSVVAK